MSIFKKLALGAALFGATLAHAGELVNINTASAQALADAITGVGDSRAAQIVAFRESNGPFASIDDLVRVSGIGQTIVDENRDRLTVGQ